MNYSYDPSSNRLISLSHNTSGSSSDNVNYSFQYNTFGTQTGIKVGTQSLVSYTYAPYNGDLTKTTYGNSVEEEPEYDALGRISALSYNGVRTYEYYYGTNGKAGLVKDLIEGVYWRYEYDQAGRLTSVLSSMGERHRYTYSSSTGELTHTSFRDPTGVTNAGTTYTYGNYESTGERLLEKIAIHGSRLTVHYDYDDFYRQQETLELNTGYTLGTSYEYRAGTGSNTTSLLPKKQTETLKDPNDNTLTTEVLNYTYDSLGNIETVKEGSTEKLRYQYDNLNQLTREDNKYLNKTIVYEYDMGGNLLEAKEYSYQTGDIPGSATPAKTDTYTYGDSNWKDKLTSYNGNAISYDAIGNPTDYYNGFTFTWQKGRQLASATDGTDTITYGYNPDGYRTSKTVNGVTTRYTLDGSLVKFEKTGSTSIWYYYNASGSPVGMCVGGTSLYLYRKNLQGDITGIYSGSTGTLLVSYVYDAWGKPTVTDEAGTTESANLIARNPYLYRGYRYDHETGLYYLNSRYYDPETGRFVNGDAMVSTNQDIHSTNMFAYCENNPIIRKDDGGKCWWIAVGALVGGIIGGVCSIIQQAATEDSINWGVVGIAAGAGALSGALASTGIGAPASIALNAAISGTAYLATQAVKEEEIDPLDFTVALGLGALSGAIGGEGANGAEINRIFNPTSNSIGTYFSPKEMTYYAGQIIGTEVKIVKSAVQYVGAEAVTTAIATGYSVVRKWAKQKSMGLSVELSQ